jgi:oxygen-dependent protoporphyrinogen oxidase
MCDYERPDGKRLMQVQDVIIIGGGITGLAAAYYLQEEARAASRPLRYTLIEREGRLGGKIATEHIGEFTIEGGPDCVISQKPWATDLARRLGLGDDLMGTNEERRKTFVLTRGRLTPLPDGVMLIIPTRITPFVTSPLISWPGKIRMGMDLFIPRRKGNADESVADFVRRRLGREALEKIAEPLMGGIHVSDPELQSLLGTFPRFRDLEMKHRSLILGMLAQKRKSAGNKAGSAATAPVQPVVHPTHAPAPTTPFITLRGGLGQLAAAVEVALTGDLLTGKRATSVQRAALPADDGGPLGFSAPDPGNIGYAVRIDDGRTLYARALVLATPAYVSGGLVSAFAPDLAGKLGAIRYVSTATVSLGYRAADVRHPLNGFGLVIPSNEGRQISACTWSSTKFNYRAPKDGVLLRCFVGGPGHEELVDLSDPELTALARRELKDIMGIDAQPLLERVYRWRKANPQYDVGHLERVQALRDRCAQEPGLFVAGAAFDGVGVPDCVRQGKAAAHGATAFLAADSRSRPQPAMADSPIQTAE